MSVWARRAARVIGVCEGEARIVTRSALMFFLLMGGYFLVRPLRDTLGISRGHEALERLIVVSALVMLLVAPVYAWGVHRLERSRLVPVVLRLCALGLVVFFGVFAVVGLEYALAGWAFYVFVSVCNLFVVSVFWSVMSDCFCLACSKRLFGLVSVGGTLGAVVGGLVTGLFAGVHVGLPAPVWAVLVSAVTLELASRCFSAIDRERPSVREDDALTPSVLSGITAIVRSRYLAGVCVYVTLSSVVWTLLYIEQGRIVDAHVASDADRIALFAAIDVVSNALAMVVQLFLAGAVMRRLGVGFALAALPAIGVLGFLALPALGSEASVLGVAPVLVGLVVFQVVRRAAQFGISKPARATLFTVVDRDQRYKAKSVIDTYVYRSGDALGAGVSRWIGSVGVGVPYFAAVLAGVWLVSGIALGVAQSRRAERMSEGGPSPSGVLAGA